MLEPDNPADGAAPTATPAPTDQETRPRRRTKKAAAPPPEPEPVTPTDAAPAKAPRRRRSAARPAADAIVAEGSAADPAGEPDAAPARPTRRRSAKKLAAEAGAVPESPPPATSPTPAAEIAADTMAAETAAMVAPSVTFVAPSTASEPAPRRRRRAAAATAPVPDELAHAATEAGQPAAVEADAAIEEPEEVRELAAEEATGARRRRRRGRRGRGRRDADEITEVAEGPDSPASDEASATDDSGADQDAEEAEGETTSASRRRRRRRRREPESADETTVGSDDDPADTVIHVREGRTREAAPQNGDGVRGVRGSTRLEAKRQRRREGRDSGRRRAPILTEAEFLARREAVDRTMAVRELGDRTQIAVLEDSVLVEHYVTRASATSYVGNVYLGRVQNVLPSMEAAFVDIGKGRNGVLYAGEVNWDISGLEGKARAIENALKSGDTVLVQVTKDPVGHKGARLTSQISLPGRFLVYVPRGGMTGISRKLPDTERHRLKSILKKVVPEDAGVIIRTAAEGATEEELTRDVERLTAQWTAIQEKARQPKSAPTLVYGEPDLAIRVVRDVFNEDFDRLIVEGDQAWATVSNYVAEVAPDLRDRASRHTGENDLFHELRVDEQLSKALSRKVFLPSGGSLVIDRTEAMTVIDVNTGKFIGAGGNLEQTVTRNNIEAAEEIVRQLRLRDIGGIIVIDFIDMVLESNRDLVLRRLIECLGRDRTKHQVAEVTSLGLVQMTRKRVGEGLLEAFSEPCPTCGGRGVLIHDEPVDQRREEASADDRPAAKRSRRKRGEAASEAAEPAMTAQQRKTAASAMAAIAGMRPAPDSDLPESAVSPAADEPAEAHADSGDAQQRAEVAEVAEVDDSRPAPVEPPSDTESELDVEAKPPADGESAEPRRARGDRRRRSASRPAGPPVPVG